MSKSIYTFTINKVAKVSEKRTEKYTDDSGTEKERSITEQVEKTIPVEILIKKPTRRQMQDAEMEFSIEMSRCIKAGILTKAMLMNKYSDNGGLVSDEDSNILDEAYDDIVKLKEEITLLLVTPEEERSEEDNELIKSKQKEIVNLRKSIIESEASYLTLFNHTADTKAQNRIVMWYVMNLSFYKDPSKDHEDFVPIFEGKTFEEKEENLYDLEEKDDDLYTKVYTRLATIVSFWYFTGKMDSDEFDRILKEQHGDEQIS